LYIVAIAHGSRVLELSDRFLDIRKDGQWLVMFYAPWCAHCKRLEPIWAHVAQALHNTNIRVGRIDCTRFTGMATEFGVSGFPTILFLKGEIQYTFRGSLWDTYSDVAEKFQPHGFFYSVSPIIAKKHINLTSLPTIFVYKENEHYFFPAESVNEDLGLEYLNSSMYDWINAERFATFPKITRGNINQLLQTRKYLVLAVVEENKLQEIPTEMLVFRDMIESVIKKNRDKFHRWFQFGWVGSPELANSIAMTVVPLPYLLVVNSTTNHHHIPEDEPSQLTQEAVTIFLEQIHNQSAPSYGGNTLPVRLYRTYFEARTSLTEMWQGNPVLTAVLFGLPLGFLSLICYSICCADIMDADEEEEDITHEKKE
ncbi:hypothetical protein L9F63_017585, partial [Diploptera punctata]